LVDFAGFVWRGEEEALPNVHFFNLELLYLFGIFDTRRKDLNLKRSRALDEVMNLGRVG
jgi:hypothetical protein